MIRCLFCAALVWLAMVGIAAAQNVVDRCATDTQGGGTRNLATALTIGGRITFACPPNTSIRMTTGHTVAAGTIVDGGNRITLDAHGNQMTMFRVPSGSFAAERLTIRNVRVAPPPSPFPHRPSVLFASGDVRLTDVSIEASQSPVQVNGNARIRRGVFRGNTGTAMLVRGEAVVERTRFIGNATGLWIRTGSVRSATFSQNSAGGLKIIYPKNRVTVTASSFMNNSGQGAIVLTQRSDSDGTALVEIKRSIFSDNLSVRGGGAITIYDSTVDAPESVIHVLQMFPPTRFELAYNRFSRNRGQSGGAIDANLRNTAGLVVRGGIFIDNVADSFGGAMFWVGKSVLITHSVFRGNRAGSRGGALYADYLDSGSNWMLANSLVAENVAPSDAGAIEVGPIALFNVTVANNVGFGFAADVHGSPPDAPLVANTIISQNSEGNCRGVAERAFQASNLQFGHSDCPGIPAADPHLDSLYVPTLGSPALDSGDVAICRAPPVSRTDIVFQSRATDNRCALGAFERPPVRRVPPIRER